MTREEAYDYAMRACDSTWNNKVCADIRKALEQEPLEVEAAKLQKAYNKGFEDCRQAVNEIINDIRDCISVEGYWAILERMKKLPSVNPTKTGKWIPVSERLPENHNQEVLISLEWGIDIGRYSDGEWHSEWINHYDDGNVLAWMPLPKPYEPQESEEV